MVDIPISDSGIFEDNKSPGKGFPGIAATDLQPAGKVEIDGEIYEAIAITGFVKRGTKVEVVHFQNIQLFVRKI